MDIHSIPKPEPLDNRIDGETPHSPGLVPATQDTTRLGRGDGSAADSLWYAHPIGAIRNPSRHRPFAEIMRERFDAAASAEALRVMPSSNAISPTADNREWLGKVQIWRDGRYARLVMDGAVLNLDDGSIVDRGELAPAPDDYIPAMGQVRGASIGVSAAEDSGEVRPGRNGGSEHSTKVRAFSRSARKRMQDTFNQLSKMGVRNSGGAVFITLTYGDDAPKDGAEYKKDLNAFRKRIDRQSKRDRYHYHSGVWRAEGKPRKTGKHAGAVVPHFHLILFNVRRGNQSDAHLKAELLSWMPQAWAEISGAPLQACDIRIERRWHKILHYMAKYVAKLERDVNGDIVAPEMPDNFGAHWGYLHRDRLPYSPVIVAYVSSLAARELLYLFRHFNGIPKDAKWALPSLSAYLHPPWLAEWLENNATVYEWRELA